MEVDFSKLAFTPSYFVHEEDTGDDEVSVRYFVRLTVRTGWEEVRGRAHAASLSRGDCCRDVVPMCVDVWMYGWLADWLTGWLAFCGCACVTSGRQVLELP